MNFLGKNIDKALDRTRARTPTARGIIAQLARHANTDLLARPSQGLLARRAGINTRQVRKILREFEALGEIEAQKKGANKPTEYRLAILSDDFLARHCGAEPNSDMDRHSTTEPKNGWTGTVGSVDRHHSAYEVIEEKAPRFFALGKDVWDSQFAEKQKRQSPPFSQPISDLSNGALIGLPGDHAREAESPQLEVRRIVPHHFPKRGTGM